MMESPNSIRGPSPEASGHTPGPWHVESTETADSIDAIAVRESAYGLFIAAVEPHDIEHAHALANARLIASAPDLLAACKRAKKLLEPEVEKEPDRTIFWELVAAIRKATEAQP